MNYEEAQKVLDENRHLEGTFLNGEEITHLIIIPTDKSALPEIKHALDKNTPIHYLNNEYQDFKIIALMDFGDYHLTDILKIKPLEDFQNT